MQHHQQEHTEAEQTTATDERLLAALDEIEVLRQQVESWRKIAQELDVELQETQQELEYTNQDLCTAQRLNQLEFEQAKELTLEILQRKKSSSESLAELLAAIYDCAVMPEQLEQIESPSNRTRHLLSAEVEKIIANSKEIRNYSKQLHSQYKELGFRFVSCRANYVKLRNHLNELTTQLRENNVSNNPANINDLMCLPPPKTYMKMLMVSAIKSQNYYLLASGILVIFIPNRIRKN